MSTTTVSIGRNVDNEPLEAEAWDDFRARVVIEVENDRLETLFVGTGSGFWEGEIEESFTIVAIGSPSRRLRAQLATLADRFNQDAIAVTTGETDLVAAASPAVRASA